jgi:hypothetical protein
MTKKPDDEKPEDLKALRREAAERGDPKSHRFIDAIVNAGPVANTEPNAARGFLDRKPRGGGDSGRSA